MWVGNLSVDTTQDDVEDVFADFGKILDLFIPWDYEEDRHRGYAFVTMAAKDAGEAHARVNGMHLNGHSIIVKEATARKDGGGHDRKGRGGRRDGGLGRGGGGGGRYHDEDNKW